MTRFKALFLVGCCLWLGALDAFAQADPAPTTVRIGVLAFKGPDAVPQDWSNVAQRLDQAIPGHHFVLEPHDLAGLTRAVREGVVDFVITNSGHYVTLEHDYGISRIATLESPWTDDPRRAIGSAIIVRAGNEQIQTLADLAGKRLDAIDPKAFGGYQVAAHELLRAGINPESAFSSLHFVGFPMQQVVEAVRDGKADAGIVGVCLLEQMAKNGEIALRDFRVLSPVNTPGFRCQSSTPLYPNWPIAVLRHTSRDLAENVAIALLKMPKSAEGYSWGVPTDYRAVNELFLDMQIGPYAYLREWSLQGFVRRYWGWLLFAMTVLVGWAIHTVRVKHLVRVRTRALYEEQEKRRSLEREACDRKSALDHVARLGTLGEMASAIAHELNQPLAAIGNFARGMVLRIEGGRMQPQPLVEAANEILAQSERAAAIIRNVRTFAQKRSTDRYPVDLRQTVTEAIALFSGAYPGAPLQVHSSPAVGQGMPVSADALQIQQVLLNLFKNAHDAQQAAGCADKPVAVELKRDGDSYCVAVRDAGIGLEDGYLARLFEPFFTTKKEGIGLGLPICMSIIEAHGGQLKATRNGDGPGLTVWFALPAA